MLNSYCERRIELIDMKLAGNKESNYQIMKKENRKINFGEKTFVIHE